MPQTLRWRPQLPCRRKIALHRPGHILRKCRDDLLAKKFDGMLDQLGSQMTKPVLRAEHVVADEGVLLSDLSDHCVGAADECEAVVNPEIVGFTPLPENATQLKTLWSARFHGISAIWPGPHAALRHHLTSGAAEFGVCCARGGEMGG